MKQTYRWDGWPADRPIHVRVVQHTVDPADGDTLNDSDDEDSKPSTVVVHQLEHVHSTLALATPHRTTLLVRRWAYCVANVCPTGVANVINF